MKRSTTAFLIAGALSLALTPVIFAAAPPAKKKDRDPNGPVSYYEDIRPIFQANCQGCHQPAKAKGGYVMTDFVKLLGKGDTGEVAIIPKKPEAGLLIKQITPAKGEAEMPKGQPPLVEHEIAIIKKWVAQGAIDDTPANARQRYDMAHPPIYTRPPVITSLDYSPDGSLIAVAGFHEVLLHKADGSGLAARLVGLAERIESVRFSPEGKQLAVAGGQPGRMGEVQIWDVEKRKLTLSVPVTYDTVYGVSWSPDAKLVAFGCSDLTVRAIEVATGKQVLQQGSHADWVLETAFNPSGSNVVSVGRDMTAKLTEVATQRFIDNITSITPGALKGGLHAVSMHPKLDQVVLGGADGAPQVYRIFRQTARKIGDNANLIRKFPDMPGRIYSVRYSKDGKQFAAASALDNVGQVVVYADAGEQKIPANIKKIMEKTVRDQTPEEKIELDKFQSDGIKLVAKTDVANCGIYAVAFSPDARTLAAAGQDGKIKLISTDGGQIAKEFAAAPISKTAPRKDFQITSKSTDKPATMMAAPKEALPKGAKITGLEILPANLKLTAKTDYAQLLVTAKLASGETADVTRLVSYKVSAPVVEVTAKGHLSPKKNGAAKLTVSLAGQSATMPVEIAGLAADYKVDFIRDVNPVLSKLGCNAGACHGAKDGKAGFKLSLRGYDPIFDVRAFTDDLASRRVNVASPDDSLMLLKATGAVPHEGGQRTKTDAHYYQILRAWIADGAKLNLNSPRVSKIELVPKDPVVQSTDSMQQVRVVATYADGRTRDVSAEAFVESGNGDVASTDGNGVVQVLRRGEAPILARYEGAYAATTVTVMGDRKGFVWKEQPANNKIDEFVSAKWQRMKILPSDLAKDEDFVRRVYLDLTGLPPTPTEVDNFLADKRDVRVKRDELIDKLVGSADFVDHWANKWADLLQVNRKFLGPEGALLFRDWIRKEVAANTPYDQFVKKILTASGSNKENPAASYFKVLRTPAETMENTTHLFLATRFNCNKCHDHPFERWTQDQYYQTAAFFAQIELKKDPAAGAATIGGTAVEGAKPLYEITADAKTGEVKHDRTGKVTPPEFPFPAKFELKKEKPTRRESLAEWITSPDNRYFAMSYVNRIWGYLLGTGIIEPLDDIRAGNPATNPELLNYLTQEFITSGFNVQQLMKQICKSRTYQLSLATHEWNADDKINYSHAIARRLPAEVLFDAVLRVTGSTPNFPGVKPGTRAAQLPDSAIDVPSGFLANLGRPARESACECERSSDLRLGSIMALLSGPAVSDAINDPKNELAKLAAGKQDDRQIVDAVFLRVLNRHANAKEIDSTLATWKEMDGEHKKLTADRDAAEKAWAPIYAKKQAERETAVKETTMAVASREKAIAPAVAAAELKRLQGLTNNTKALAAYEKALSQKLAEWEKTLGSNRLATAWVPLEIKDSKATGGVTLKKQKDGSLLATGGSGLSDYTITAETKLAGITGVMIEALPDESLPKFGPGRAKDGNFVLTQFQLNLGENAGKKRKRANPATAVRFKDAAADFSQKNYEVKTAIEGKGDNGKKGWGIAGKPFGEPRYARFSLVKPVGDEDGATLTFTMQHKFRESYQLGRFRLWVTASKSPLELGLPEKVLAVVKTPVADRTEAQTKDLLDWFRTADVGLIKKEQALYTSKQPLPIDPKLLELRAAAAKAELPVPIDSKLVQLRADVIASTPQTANKRLTGVQDLAWALVNNPAFLFNR